MKKLTLKKFNEIKKELLKIQEDIANCAYHLDRQWFINNHIIKQEQLLSYDLSDIPFEAWEGIEIYNNKKHPMNFDGTKANIDFKFVRFHAENGIQNSSFKTCKIKNIVPHYGFSENVFDEEVVNEHSDLFLPANFNGYYKYKFNENTLLFRYLFKLTDEEFESLLKIKNLERHFGQTFDKSRYTILSLFNFKNALIYYRNYEKDLEDITQVVNNLDFDILKYKLSDKLYNCKPEDVKQIIYKYARKRIFSEEEPDFMNFGNGFINENRDIYDLFEKERPYGLNYKLKERELDIFDIIPNFEYFKDIPLDFFIDYDIESEFLEEILRHNGPGHINKLLKKHIDFFKKIYNDDDGLTDFSDCFISNIVMNKRKIDIDKTIMAAAKEYYISEKSEEVINKKLPKYMGTFGLEVLNKIRTKSDFEKIDETKILGNPKQRYLLDHIGLNFIKEIDEETGIFSKYPINNDNAVLFNALSEYIHHTDNDPYDSNNKFEIRTYFDYGKEKDRIKKFAGFLEALELKGYFKKLEDPKCFKKAFAKKYPNAFLSEDLPLDFRRNYYNNELYLNDFQNMEKQIPYFEKINILDSLNVSIRVGINHTNYLDYFRKKFGDKKTLELICKYGKFLYALDDDCTILNIEDEEEIYKHIRKLIYSKILRRDIEEYERLKNIKEMVKEYPNIFINLKGLKIKKDIKEELENKFYYNGLDYEDIREYPELIKALEKIDFKLAFRNYVDNRKLTKKVGNSVMNINKELNNNDLIHFIGKDNFMKLCKEYGYLMNNIYTWLFDDFMDNIETIDPTMSYTFEGYLQGKTPQEIIDLVEKLIYEKIKYGRKTIPEFLKEKYPEFVLDDDVANEYHLEDCFSRGKALYEFNEHKEWVKALKGKSIMTLILLDQWRTGTKYDKYLSYFKKFGEKTGTKLALSKFTTVQSMIENDQLYLMWNWYSKSGKKFLPDKAVMEVIPFDEADKFFNNLISWKEINKSPEYNCYFNKKVLTNLAMIFGVFDDDKKGISKLKDLIYKVPSKAKDNDFANFLKRSSKEEKELIIDKDYLYDDEMLKKLDLIDEIKDMAIKEGLKIDKNKPLLSQLYKLNDDGSYTLTFNQNGHQDLTIKLRALLYLMLEEDELYSTSPLCYRAANINFLLKLKPEYNKSFRDFLASNLKEILNDDNASDYIEEIQKSFPLIKAYNSNIKLTYNAAVNYVKTIKYPNMDIGNERLSNISSIAGYGEKDFTVLQDIYNLGKQRIYSTIPRIENTITINGNTYHYEFLRLDDPLTLAIGTLTDCCQRIHKNAQVTMEQSMVENNTRIFLIKDDEGNFVAQSWVWRNKDVLCYDNVEIPHKAFDRYEKKNPGKDEEDFHDEIYDIYEKASKEIMKLDNQNYEELLKAKKITKKEYDSLRLGLITIGEGNNDLDDTLYDRTIEETYDSLEPPEYETQFFKDTFFENLYTDADGQYVVVERDDRIVEKGDEEAKPVYTDTYEEYTDKTLDTSSLLILKSLEYNDNRYYNSISKVEIKNEGKYVTELARVYGTDPSKTKVVMNPNFGIIYEDNNDTITIVDIVYNLKVKEKEKTISIEKVVLEQIKLALEQIAKNKKIVLDDLDEDSEKLYKKVIVL